MNVLLNGNGSFFETKEHEMVNLRLDYHAMKSQAANIRTGSQDISDMLKGMESQVKDLVENGFVTDDASGAFDESFKKFIAGTQATIQGANRMAQYLSNVMKAMYDLERQMIANIK